MIRRNDPVKSSPVAALKRTGKRLYWEVCKRVLEHPPVPPAPASLLFVCKGNICRSPFAEAMARRYIPDGLSIEVGSAGLDVKVSEPCPTGTLEAAKRFGIDLSGHRSLRIDAKTAADADMILAMEAWQIRRLRKTFPEHREKIHLLPLFDMDPVLRTGAEHLLNIQDPYGRSLADFIECFERIESCLKGIFSRIHNAGIPNPTAGAARR